MTDPLFSEKEKTKLAQQKVLYEHNTAEARQYQQCSLNAARALLEIIQLFSEASLRIRNQKEMVEFQTRLQSNARVVIQFKAQDLATQKVELSDMLTKHITKTRRTITRLRKSLS